MLEFLIPSKEETSVVLHIGDSQVEADLGDLQLLLERAWEMQSSEKSESAIPYFITMFENEHGVSLGTGAAMVLMDNIYSRMNSFKKKSLILPASSEEQEPQLPTTDSSSSPTSSETK
jgi:hypothetical protein